MLCLINIAYCTLAAGHGCSILYSTRTSTNTRTVLYFNNTLLGSVPFCGVFVGSGSVGVPVGRRCRWITAFRVLKLNPTALFSL